MFIRNLKLNDMITQIIWLASLPLMMFVTYKAVFFVYKYIDKKHNL